MSFGTVTDYFGLASDTLIAESSNDGTYKPHVVAYNANGRGTISGDTPATNDGVPSSNIHIGAWYNPTVTYRVVGDMTLDVTLGKGYCTTVSTSTAATRTGYMITKVTVQTRLGNAPTVTVSGTANESGLSIVNSVVYQNNTVKDAVRKWSVSIPISARHRPQNLLSAISGGGELQELTLSASVDPVVVSEKNFPCASDAVHGRIEVSAVTAAYEDEDAPTAGSDFIQVGAPVSQSGIGYTTYSVNVREELK